MKPTFKILVATDFSDISGNAERYAAALAKDTNSELTLFHAYDALVPPAGIGLEYADVFEKYRVEQQKRLQTRMEEIRSATGANVKLSCKSVEDPSASAAIRDEVRNANYDLIILGTHGSSGLLDKLMGSHTWAVLKKASVPVIAVPGNLSYKGFSHMVFATEYRGGELPVIQYLAELASGFKARLTLVHVSKYALSKEYEKEMYSKFKAKVQDRVSYDQMKVHLIKDEDLAHGLNEYCEREEADLLVVAPQKPFLVERLFMPESSTKILALNSKFPLFAVPDFYNPDYAGFWERFSQGDIVNEEF